MMTSLPSGPLVLCILDGWGYRQEKAHNVLAQAHLPTWQRLLEQSPFTLLEASAHNVGLPEGQMGNSEVGHMNIGAGRIIRQDLPRIDHALASDAFVHLPLFKDFVNKLQISGGCCHIMGLLSPGGVHSHQNHLIAVAKALSHHKIPVRLHLFLDGRDTPPRSGLDFMKNLTTEIQNFPNIEVASLSGRYYAMDRDQRWNRVEKAYRAIAHGKAPFFATALEAIQAQYDQGVSDEFIEPQVSGIYSGMQDGDGLLHLNFRADRVRQLLTAFVDPGFTSFDRGPLISCAAVAGMASYGDALTPFCPAFFPPQQIQDTLGDVISAQGLTQLRAAETEKYAHVTFFFNGGREEPLSGEDRLLIPSPAVATYDLQPEMSAVQLTNQLIAAYQEKRYDVIIVNYANADMVGHSGFFEAAQKAVEAIDGCLARLCALVDATSGCLVITADHGNVEQMFDEDTQQPHTAHTLNPVPFVVYGKTAAPFTLHPGQLCDIAPTMLQLLKIVQPAAMTGKSLID